MHQWIRWITSTDRYKKYMYTNTNTFLDKESNDLKVLSMCK